MNSLILKKTRAHYGEDHWSDTDYVVLDDGGKIIGRILWTYAAPQDRRWMWSITARIPNSVHDRGYSETREQAVAQFRARWFVLPTIAEVM